MIPVLNRAVSPRRVFQFFALVVLTAAQFQQALATPIDIDLGPPGRLAKDLSVAFPNLNGIALTGQTLSLDLLFSGEQFTRLFSSTHRSFASLLMFQTLPPGHSGFTGFASATGFLLDQNLQPLAPAEDLGSEAAGNGSFAVGLFPLQPGELQRPVDFFGIHVDLTLPDRPGFSVMNSEFRLAATGVGVEDVFGIGPGVPRDISDLGSTLLCFGIALVGLRGLGALSLRLNS